MPETSTGPSIERQQGVGEKIGALSITTVEIRCRGSGRDVNDAALGIHGQTCPRVGTAFGFPGVGGPRLVAEFSGMRNGVKRPANGAGADIVGADIARR